MKKIVIITTMSSSIKNWIIPFLNEYHRNHIDVTIVCNMDLVFETWLKNTFPFVHTYSIDFPRGIKVRKSIKAYLLLKKFLKKQNFDLIQYSTPNASFYASLAAKKVKIPVRLYCQWGMVFVTMNGLKRFIFKIIEKIICNCSTIIQPDSKGNLEYCRREGFYNNKKSEVIWNGSAKGVDLTKFDINKKQEYRYEIRKLYNINQSDPVIGFVGRLGKEKGFHELIDAYKTLKHKYSNLKMIFVGPLEKKETIKRDYLDYFLGEKDIIKTGRIDFVEKILGSIDVFILPSYREGFGMSVLEASAFEVPVIATSFPGPGDTLIHGVTGYFCKIKDYQQIVSYVDKILSSSILSKQLGAAGRVFVKEKFEQKEFIKRTIENRLKLLELTE